MTRDEVAMMYADYPAALEEEVMQALSILKDDRERVIHNVAVQKIIRVLPTTEMQQAMWRNVARAIIQTFQTGVQRNGKDK